MMVELLHPYGYCAKENVHEREVARGRRKNYHLKI